MAERLDWFKPVPSVVMQWQATIGGGDDALRARYPQAKHVHVEANDPQPTTRASPVTGASRDASRWWHLGRWMGAIKSQRPDPSVPAPMERVRSDAVPADSAQLLWANMVLHGAHDAPALLRRWHRALKTDGWLMFSTVGPDTLKELRALYAREGWGPLHAPLTDMHDIGDELLQAGFADPVMDQERITLTWSNAQAMLEELRTLGSNTAPQRFAGLRTPRWRARLEQALADMPAASTFQVSRQPGESGRIAMTIEVVYGHAFKVAPRASSSMPQETRVSVETLRATARKPTR